MVIEAKAATVSVPRQYHELAINQALEITLPDSASSAILANPEIADILVQSRISLVISGKKIGVTNLLVRDKSQNTILEIQLQIIANATGTISIFGGTARADYSCLDGCRKISGEQNAANETPLNVPTAPLQK